MKNELLQLKSTLNRVKAQLHQLLHCDFFSEKEKQTLKPFYESQITELEKKITNHQTHEKQLQL